MHANADSHPLQPNHLNKISFYALIDPKLIDVFKVKNILLITNSLFFFLNVSGVGRRRVDNISLKYDTSISDSQNLIIMYHWIWSHF